MAELRISDLVDPKAIEDIQKLNSEMSGLRDSFLQVTKDLGKGLKLQVEGIEDLDRLSKVVQEAARKTTENVDKTNQALGKQKEVFDIASKKMEEHASAAERDTAMVDRNTTEAMKSAKTLGELSLKYEEVRTSVEKKIGSHAKNLKAYTEEQTKITLIKQEQADWNKKLKEGKVLTDQYNSVMTKLNSDLREHQAESKRLNLVMNAQEKEMNATIGTYEKLSQQLELMKKALKAMSDEEKNTAGGLKLAEAVDELDLALKKSARSMGENQRNVGDYKIAGESMKKELRSMTEELANLILEFRNLSDEEKKGAKGRELSEKIKGLTRDAAELKDAIGDAGESIKGAASDTAGFDALTGALKMLTDGFTIAEGGAHLLGLSEKDLVEVQTKLQAAFTVSNALQDVQQALQKQSALMLGVTRVQTLAAAAAIRVKNAAEGEGVVVTKLAIVAQRTLNAVAKMNPYVLLATAILTVVGAIALFTKGSKKMTEEEKEAAKAAAEEKKRLDDLKDVQKQLNDAREAGVKSAANEISKLTVLYKAATNVNKPMRERMDAVKELKKQYPEYLGKLSDEVILAGKAADAYAALKNNIIESAIARAKEERIAEIAKEYEKVTEEINQKTKSLEMSSKVQGYEVHDDNVVGGTSYHSNEKHISEQQEALSVLQKQANEYMHTMEQIASTIDVSKIIKSDKSTSTSTASSSEARETQKTQEEVSEIVLNARKSTLQQQIQMESEHSETVLSLKRQLAEIDEELSIRSAKKSYATQLVEMKKSLDAQKISKEEYTKSVEALDEQYRTAVQNAEFNLQKSITEAQEETNEARITKIEERYSVEQSIRDTNYTKEIADEEKHYAELLSHAEESHQSREKVEEEHNLKMLEIHQKYERDTAKDAVDTLKEQMEVAGLTEEQRESLEQQLAKATADYEKMMADQSIEYMEAVTDAHQKQIEKRMKAVQFWGDFTKDMLNELTNLAGALYDSQISEIEKEEDALDEKKEKDIERIEELEESKVITTEEAEARKRAAEESSERKHEELEKKKAAIEYKQAILEKANKVAQIGISTALGIMQALAMFPPNIPLSITVGAIGAVQLAAALAQPIKAYAKGTPHEGHHGGLAVVGDGGKPELVTFKGKSWITPDKPTVVNLPKGAHVYPDARALSVEKFTETLSNIGMSRFASAISRSVEREESSKEKMKNLSNAISEKKVESEGITKEQVMEFVQRLSETDLTDLTRNLQLSNLPEEEMDTILRMFTMGEMDNLSKLSSVARELIFNTLSEKPMAGANTPIVNVNTSNPEEVKESKKTNALLKGLMKQNARIAYLQRFHERMKGL